MKKDLNKEEEKLKAVLKNTNEVFNTPAGYFDFLPDKILSQVKANLDFESEASVNPFEVPDNYFDKLPSALNERITSRKNGFREWLASITSRRIAIPLALATVVIVASLFYFKKNNDEIKKETYQISADDLKNSTYIESIDEEMFVDILASQNINTTDDSLEQYLIDNNIDLSQIENNL